MRLLAGLLVVIGIGGCKTTSSSSGLQSESTGTDCEAIWRDLQADPQAEGGSLRARYDAECASHRPSVAGATGGGTDCEAIWRDLQADPEAEGGSLRARYDAECASHRPAVAAADGAFRTFAKCGAGSNGAWRFEVDESTSSAAARLRFHLQKPLLGKKDNADDRDPISHEYSFGEHRVSIRLERRNDRYPAMLSLPGGKTESLDCFLP